MRNCYIHYQNVMLYQQRIDEEVRRELTKLLPKVKKEIRNYKVDERLKEMALSEAEAMCREVDTDDTLIKRKIPYQGLRISSEVDKFREERVHELLGWVYDAWPYKLIAAAYKKGIDTELENRLKKQLTEYKRRYNYGIERYDARDCLIWSSEILSRLGFL